MTNAYFFSPSFLCYILKLRATGAKAIADHISKLKSVSRLDISDNGKCRGFCVSVVFIEVSTFCFSYLSLRQQLIFTLILDYNLEKVLQTKCNNK